MAAGHRVAIVVARGFETEARRTVDAQHVWAIRAPEYLRVADEHRQGSPDHSLEQGVTLFGPGGGTPEEELVAIFGTVEEHHGAYSHDPPLDRVEVVGAAPTPQVRAELGSYGFTDLVASERGFVASR